MSLNIWAIVDLPDPCGPKKRYALLSMQILEQWRKNPFLVFQK